VGIDVADVGRRHVGPAQSGLDREPEAEAIGVRAGDVLGVAAHSPTNEIRERRRAAGFGVGLGLQHEGARSLAHDEAAPLRVVRSGRACGIAVVGARQRPRIAETGHRVEPRGGLPASGDHHVRFPREQHHRRHRDGVARGGASAGDVEARPHEAVFDGNHGGNGVEHDAGNEVGRNGAWTALVRAPDLLFEDLDRSLPGRDEDADPGFVDVGELGFGDRFCRCRDGKLLDLAVDDLLLFVEPA
jgi:hypothetical protein